jgi:5-oxoprolinase (ATP-hydrolysing)
MTQVMNTVNEFKRAEALRDGKPFEPLTVEEVAMGFVRVANETMSRPIRNLTQARGFDARDHELACFGGAGAQHACAIARALGMSRVHVHKYAGILSAFGMALADVVHEAQEFCGRNLEETSMPYVVERFEALRAECEAKLSAQGLAKLQSAHYYHPITYYWTSLLIWDHSYLVGNFADSKIAETKALEPLKS